MKTNFGKWLKSQVDRSGIPVREFAVLADISSSRIYDWFNQPAPQILPFKLVGIAKALGIPIEEVQRQYDSSRTQTKVAAAKVGRLTIPVINRISASKMDNHDSDVLEDVLDIGHAGEFALICDGDCMEPEWHHGEYVIFSEATGKGIAVGDDVGVYRTGGDTTFKRVVKVDGDGFDLRAVNPKYKNTIHIPWEDAQRVGKAKCAFRMKGRNK
jgi:SOS-response transcriptional repressor LexA